MGSAPPPVSSAAGRRGSTEQPREKPQSFLKSVILVSAVGLLALITTVAILCCTLLSMSPHPFRAPDKPAGRLPPTDEDRPTPSRTPFEGDHPSRPLPDGAMPTRPHWGPTPAGGPTWLPGEDTERDYKLQKVYQGLVDFLTTGPQSTVLPRLALLNILESESSETAELRDAVMRLVRSNSPEVGDLLNAVYTYMFSTFSRPQDIWNAAARVQALQAPLVESVGSAALNFISSDALLAQDLRAAVAAFARSASPEARAIRDTLLGFLQFFPPPVAALVTYVLGLQDSGGQGTPGEVPGFPSAAGGPALPPFPTGEGLSDADRRAPSVPAGQADGALPAWMSPPSGRWGPRASGDVGRFQKLPGAIDLVASTPPPQTPSQTYYIQSTGVNVVMHGPSAAQHGYTPLYEPVPERQSCLVVAGTDQLGITGAGINGAMANLIVAHSSRTLTLEQLRMLTEAYHGACVTQAKAAPGILIEMNTQGNSLYNELYAYTEEDLGNLQGVESSVGVAILARLAPRLYVHGHRYNQHLLYIVSPKGNIPDASFNRAYEVTWKSMYNIVKLVNRLYRDTGRDPIGQLRVPLLSGALYAGGRDPTDLAKQAIRALFPLLTSDPLPPVLDLMYDPRYSFFLAVREAAAGSLLGQQ